MILTQISEPILTLILVPFIQKTFNDFGKWFLRNLTTLLSHFLGNLLFKIRQFFLRLKPRVKIFCLSTMFLSLAFPDYMNFSLFGLFLENSLHWKKIFLEVFNFLRVEIELFLEAFFFNELLAVFRIILHHFP